MTTHTTRGFPQPDNRLEVENGDRRVVLEFAEYDSSRKDTLVLFERLALVVLGAAE